MTGTARSIDSLAWVLAKNHFLSSLPPLDGPTGPNLLESIGWQGFLEAHKEPLHQYARWVFHKDRVKASLGEPERVILVVGSGASVAAFGTERFPTTERAIERLESDLRLNDEALEELRRYLWSKKEKLQEAYGFEEAFNDFETNLAIYAEAFSSERVTDLLVRMYGAQGLPHLIFELIAHMFRHRFIDVIINFNFDELLDEAIRGEMGTTQYEHVISDDCAPLDSMLVGGRLKVPLHIKPHGTVSHRSTLRFTKDQYFQLPEAIRSLMADALAGHWLPADERQRPKSTSPYRPYRVNVITIGFSMKSLDLLSILKKNRADGLPVTFFHLDLTEGNEKLRALGKKHGWGKGKWKQHFINVDGGLGETLLDLWNRTRQCFNARFGPRGIARHEITHRLFHAPDRKSRLPVPKPDGSDAPSDLPYFRARLCAELAMALARGNGVIDLSTLSSTRVGRYFDLIRRHAEDDLSLLAVLRSFVGGGASVELTGSDVTCFQLPDAFWEDTDPNRALAKALWQHLRDALCTISDRDFQTHLDALDGDEMVGLFEKLASSDAQDINARFRHSSLLLSARPHPSQVLHTPLSLTLAFANMLSTADWHLMLAVSESGKVMEKVYEHLIGRTPDVQAELPDKFRLRRFCLVVAKGPFHALVENRLAQFRSVLLGPPDDAARHVFSIPPDDHNQHMVLLLRQTRDGVYEPVTGLQYRKLGVANRVSPVVLSHPDDLRAALRCFQQYIHRSEYGVAGHCTGPVAETPGELWQRVLNRKPLAQLEIPLQEPEPDAA